MMGSSPEMLMGELKKREEYQKIEHLTDESKFAEDSQAWTTWITNYRKRVAEIEGFEKRELGELNKERTLAIKGNNPKYVLRNYLAQNAIEKAEGGDYSEVDGLLKRLHDPYLFYFFNNIIIFIIMVIDW